MRLRRLLGGGAIVLMCVAGFRLLPESAEGIEAFRDLARASLREGPPVVVVYGTLQPGERNYDVIAPISGSWSDCTVNGSLHETGWGAVVGFPAIRLDPAAPAVGAQLLTSPALPDHWARLDRFEGDEYRRVLVPVHDGRNIVAVANIYEAREIPTR